MLAADLRERGHEVLSLVRRPGSEPPGTRAVAGDLEDGDGLRRALADTRPDAVVHLAAEIASQRDSRRVHEVNVGGTERLLAACREAGAGGDDGSGGGGGARGAEGGPRIVFSSTVVTGEANG